MTKAQMTDQGCGARTRVMLAAVGSAAALGGAFVFQSLGYAPCHLCILERWPHAAAVVIGLAILALRLPMVTALLGALAALTTAGIGIYHSLVERHIIAGPDSCTAAKPAQMSAADLLAQIQNTPLVRCDDIAWSFLGVTMPNLNVVLSLILAAIWVSAFVKARKTA